jgi:topoisomerase IV subunit B
MPEDVLEFEGQTKGKLGTPEARNATDTVVYEKMTTYWKKIKLLQVKLLIVHCLLNVLEMQQEKLETKQEMESLNRKKKFLLSGKLTPAQGKDKSLNELVLSRRGFSWWFC